MSYNNKPKVTDQAPINLTVRLDVSGITKRKANAGNPAYNNRIYEHGAEEANYRVNRDDLLLGRRENTLAKTSSYGQNYETVIASWNGISTEFHVNANDLADEYYFVGASKTDFDPFNNDGKSTSMAALASGPATIRLNSPTVVYAGDGLMWCPPDFDAAKRFKHEFQGQPPNKLHTVVKRFSWNELRKVTQVTYLDAVNEMTLRTPHSSSTARALSKNERRALALSKHYSMAVTEGIRDYAIRGLIDINTPAVSARKRALFTRLAQAGVNLGNATTLDELLLMDQSNQPGAVTADVPETSAINGTNLTFSDGNRDIDSDYFGKLSEYLYGDRIPGAPANAANPSLRATERLRGIQNGLLWLAARTGATRNDQMSNNVTVNRSAEVRKSLLHTQHHVWCPPQLAGSHSPDFALVDPDAASDAVQDYLKCAGDVVIEYEQMLAEHKGALSDRCIGMVTETSDPAGPNPEVAVLLGHRSGNVPA